MAFPKIEGYVVTEKLGSGSYSTVYKAYTKVGARQVVAIKSIDKNNIKHSGSAVDNLISEIRMLNTLVHPHIVEMKHFLWDKQNIYIITEYCCGGDLSKYIHRYGKIPEKRMLYFLQQLVSALKFLREKGVTHMDLKPHNLLLHKGSDGKYILKVADFGFAAYVSGSVWGGGARGSPLYMAPEMFLASSYDERVDLWSLGVIMFECLFGKAPYSSATFKELLDKIHSQQPIQIPPKPAISSGCRSLLEGLLQHDPEKRISFSDLFSHPYVDLEHVPTKANFDKGAALISRAVSLDAAGRWEESLCLYREGLSLLVPHATHEADPDRRAALHAQLRRYMQRAEEVKDYVRYLQTGEVPTLSTLSTLSTLPTLPTPPTPTRDAHSVPTDTPRIGGGNMAACCLSPNTISVDTLDNIKDIVNGQPDGQAQTDDKCVVPDTSRNSTRNVEQNDGCKIT